MTAQVPETEHAVSEHAVRDRHQLRTLAVAIVALSAVFGGVIVTILYALSLFRSASICWRKGCSSSPSWWPSGVSAFRSASTTHAASTRSSAER